MKALLSTTSFSEFIRSEHLANEQGVNPQVVALADRDGKLLVDFVAKVENLEVDWEFLTQKTGISTALQLRNESAWRFPNARDYFGDGDIEYLASMYKDDFALFEYTC